NTSRYRPVFGAIMGRPDMRLPIRQRAEIRSVAISLRERRSIPVVWSQFESRRQIVRRPDERARRLNDEWRRRRRRRRGWRLRRTGGRAGAREQHGEKQSRCEKNATRGHGSLPL